MTFEDVPVPPGLEEVFIAVQGATAAWPDIIPVRRREFLVYRDGHGQRRIGSCILDNAMAAGLECRFGAPIAATPIGMTYSLPLGLLPHRRAIEDGLHAMIGGWVLENE